jgi:hypothetical protein
MKTVLSFEQCRSEKSKIFGTPKKLLPQRLFWRQFHKWRMLMSENPYKPPASEVSVAAGLTRSIWRKIYFLAITFISCTGMVSYLTSEGAGIAEYLSLASLIVATTGLFGFTFLKKILAPSFWSAFLIAYIIFGFAYMFITKVDLQMGMSDEMYYGSLAFGIVISLPGYYALYSYGKRNNPIWIGVQQK